MASCCYTAGPLCLELTNDPNYTKARESPSNSVYSLCAERHSHLVLVLHELSLPSKPALQSTLFFFFAPAPRPNSRPEFNPNFPKTTKSPVSPFPPPSLMLNRPLPVLFYKHSNLPISSIHLSIHSSFHPSNYSRYITQRKTRFLFLFSPKRARQRVKVTYNKKFIHLFGI